MKIYNSAVACLLLLLGLSAGFDKGKEIIESREGRRVAPEIRRPAEEMIGKLKLPPGFQVTKFAEGLGAPRMMAAGEDGIVYMTRRDRGDVIALKDRDGDGKAEEQNVVVRNMPGVHGIAIQNGRMYLCTVNELYVSDLKNGTAGMPRRILSDLPPGGRHPNRTIAFGPDGWLYISVGSTCNACVEKNRENAAMLRVKPDGSERTIFAAGLRNTVGFGWHPVSKEMYGMDHGADWLGDDFPPEELNRIDHGKHYGWPLVYAKGRLIKLKDYPKGFNREECLAKSTPSVLEYQAHSAPLQMVFYTGKQFPEEYRNDAFVAMHGSWNRKPPAGYEVVRVRFTRSGRPIEFKQFLTGFLVDAETAPWAFGRPAGLAAAKDGSLLVGCDQTGIIYGVRSTLLTNARADIFPFKFG
jgi:glucose/arabinose dehydrogenase